MWSPSETIVKPHPKSFAPRVIDSLFTYLSLFSNILSSKNRKKNHSQYFSFFSRYLEKKDRQRKKKQMNYVQFIHKKDGAILEYLESVLHSFPQSHKWRSIRKKKISGRSDYDCYKREQWSQCFWESVALLVYILKKLLPHLRGANFLRPNLLYNPKTMQMNILTFKACDYLEDLAVKCSKCRRVFVTQDRGGGGGCNNEKEYDNKRAFCCFFMCGGKRFVAKYCVRCTVIDYLTYCKKKIMEGLQNHETFVKPGSPLTLVEKKCLCGCGENYTLADLVILN